MQKNVKSNPNPNFNPHHNFNPNPNPLLNPSHNQAVRQMFQYNLNGS